MGIIIDEIVRYKQEELAYTKTKTPLSQLKAMMEDVTHRNASFKDKLKRKQKESIRLIAEIKKASPSKGVIRQDLDVEETARIYEEKGASAISVLTEKRYFGGSIEDLETVSKCTTVPLLRKDFIFDPYQIYEARIYGAKATLLIASVIERSLIVDLKDLALELGLDCLVEVHTLKDLEKALYAGAEIVGINNRDLKTLKVDLSRTCQMLPDIPKDRVVVSESGIRERQDVQRLEQAGVDAILVGTVLMESQSIAQTIDTLLGR